MKQQLLLTHFFLFRLNASTTHYWQVIPYGSDHIPASNCPVWEFTTTPPTVISQFPYVEDFEQGQGDWNIQGKSPSWAFGTPNKAIIRGAASGVNAFVTGGLGVGLYNSSIPKSNHRLKCVDNHYNSISYYIDE